jgi:hypothetical protein
MRERILLLFLLISLLPAFAYGTTVSRVTDFVPNTKAEADEVDAEFDNIISAINGNLDSDNIRDGGIATSDLATGAVTEEKVSQHTLTLTSIATNTGAYLYNRRVGCLLNGDQSGVDGTRGFKVLTPCEVVIDGVRAVLAATADVSTFRNMDTGSASFSTWHYVYIKANGGLPTFNISLTAPDLSTLRKIGDATSRYLGAVRTAVGTDSIVFFKTSGRGNEYHLYNTAVFAPYPESLADRVNSLGTSAVNRIADVPVTASAALFRSKATGSATGNCELTLYNNELFDQVVYSTVPNYSLTFSQPVFNRVFLDNAFSSSNNCSSVDLISNGFIEPTSIYR